MSKTRDQTIEERIASIDWDAISDQNRIEAIGMELYEVAERYEGYGLENAVATVASVLDSFFSSVPRRMDRKDGQHVVNGFMRGLMLAKCRTIEEEDK